MRLALAFGLALVAAPVAAAECNTYTSELWEPGVRTAQYEADKLVITDHGTSETYEVRSVGTGIPYRAAMRDGEALPVRTYKDALIVQMEVFEPYCD